MSVLSASPQTQALETLLILWSEIMWSTNSLATALRLWREGMLLQTTPEAGLLSWKSMFSTKPQGFISFPKPTKKLNVLAKKLFSIIIEGEWLLELQNALSNTKLSESLPMNLYKSSFLDNLVWLGLYDSMVESQS